MDLDLTRLKAINDDKAEQAGEETRHQELLLTQTQLQEVVVKSFKTLVDYLDNRVGRTEVVNQLREIGTPDAFRVAEAVDSLHETLKTHENTDLTEITGVMRQVLDEAKKIPKELPKQQEIKTYDYTKQLTSLEKAVQAVEKVVKEQKLIAEAPIVNVPETVVNVEKPDLKPLQKNLADVVSAVNQIVIPELDTSEIEKLIKKSNTLLNKLLEKPVSSGGGGGGGRATPYEDSNGIPHFVVVDSDGSIPTSYIKKALTEVIEVVDANNTYIGQAAPGSSLGASVWRIKKIVVSGSTTTIGWANGDGSFSYEWDERASYTYA